MSKSKNKKLEGYEYISKLLARMPMIFYVLDKDWNFLLSDGQGLKKLGLTPGEVVGLNARTMYQDYPDFIEAIEKTFRGNNVNFNHSLGDLFLENNIAPFYSEGGKIEGVIGAAIDITDRTLNEIELDKTRALYEALMDSVPGIIYLYDDHGELIFWNKSHEILTGYSKEELYHRTLMDWYKDDPNSQQEVIKGLEATAKNGYGVAVANLQCKDDSILPLYLTACPLKMDGKDYFVGIGVDISSRVEAEMKLQELNRTLENKVTERTQELKVSNEELSAANEEFMAMNEEIQAMNEQLALANKQLIKMQDFLVESEKMAALGGLVAGVAHEVNTPIGVGVTAASHLMDISNELLALRQIRPLNDDDISSYLEDIEKASNIIFKNLNRAAHLIQSFKLLSVDQSTEPKRQFNLGAYIEEVLLSLSPSLKKTKIAITTHCPHKIIMNGYPGSIAQIITNLVMNSLKHAYQPGDSGQIQIDLKQKGSMVQISYSDDGKGMDEYTLGKIYEPFFTTNRAAGGTGLGLSILFSIVTQQYQGTIKCTSKLGNGTTFKIEIKGDIE